MRWVVLSHVHTDHAGGLFHFPKSEIVTSRTDFECSRGFRGRARGFLRQHWPDWFAPTLIEHTSEPFRPFQQSTVLTAAGDQAEHLTADGVASIGVLDRRGSIAVRIPVVDNVYVAGSLPADANGPLVALDSASRIIVQAAP